MKKQCAVLVVCEDDKTREVAGNFCEELIRRFWECYDLEVNSFSSKDLSKPTARRKAAQLACHSDFIVFSLSEHSMEPQMLAWAESALAKRCAKEGYVALLSPVRHSRNELFLRNLAHRAGLDFITEPPPTLETNLPEAPEPYTDRAHEMSGLLADILRRPPPTIPRLPSR